MSNGESSHSDPNLSEKSLTLCCGKKNCPTVTVVENLDHVAARSLRLEDEGQVIQMNVDQAALLRDWLNVHFPVTGPI